ncbi:MAG TPA: POTRA domain-containing protein [Terriglobales bacterium]|nr:POTRA domain-containing protein [Terriglobales bacterium]
MGQDHRTNQSGGVQVVDLTVTGTQSLSSGQVTTLTGRMIGGCYDDDSDELQERVRALFQDEGYFYVDVKSFHIVQVDPLKTPKLVKLEAEVNEGQQVRVNEINFTGNHHFSSDKLRAAFSLKAGDVFDRSLIAGGLQGVRKIYVAEGFLDMVMIPDTKNVGRGVNLAVEVQEGPQYHMDQLDVFAKKEIADRVRAAWELRQGQVYDPAYLEKFLDEHQSLLPAGFGRSSVQTVRDCPDATVNVRFIMDAVEAAAHPAKPVACEKSQDSNP